MGISHLALGFPWLCHHPSWCAWRSLKKSTWDLLVTVWAAESSFVAAPSLGLSSGINDLCEMQHGGIWKKQRKQSPRLQDHKN